MSPALGGCYFSIMVAPRAAGALRPTFETIARQDFRDFETIFLDDGTIDGLADRVARDLRNARTERVATGVGLAEAVNSAAAVAAGRYLAFLEPDDVWHPRYLSYQSAVFESVPDALYSRVGYCTRGLTGDGFLPSVAEPADAPHPVLDLLASADLPTLSCFAVPRSLFLRIGGLDARAGCLLRTDLEVRLLGGLRSGGRLSCEEHPAPRVPQVLVMKRLAHETDDIADGLARWSADLPVFLDGLFARPFMQRFENHRGWFEARLVERHCALLRTIDASLRIAA